MNQTDLNIIWNKKRKAIKIETQFIREDDEEFDDYAIRLYKNKSVYVLTHDKIGEILNRHSGNDWDESAYRKKYTPYIEGYDEGYDRGYEEGMDLDDKERSYLIDELRDEREKNFKVKRQMQDKLREYRGYMTTEARSDNLRGILLESVDELNYNYPIVSDKPIIIDRDSRVGVLQISDWHYGEVIEDNINTYNKEICKDRVVNLMSQTIDYIKEFDIQLLKILNLGDLIAGNIRISARVMNETDVISQSIEISEILVQFIYNIQRETGVKIEFYSVLDNHSRVSSNYNQHIEAESYGRLIPWYLEGRFKDDENIVIIENKINEISEYDIGRFKLYESDFLFVHGHNDKIKTIISDISMLTRITPISVFMGHYHRNYENEDFEIDLIANPSLIGSGVFSKSIRRSSKPRQKLNIYKRGLCGKAQREMTIFIEVD